MAACALGYARRLPLYLGSIGFRDLKFLLIDDGYEQRFRDLWMPGNERQAKPDRWKARYSHFAEAVGPGWNEDLYRLLAELELGE